MNDKEFITSIRDQCNSQLGGGSAPVGQVAPITVKPDPFADLKTGNQDPQERQIAAGQVVAVDFTITPGSKGRNLRWFGSPGQFWDYNSWAIFDSGGNRVAFGDNVLVVGALGFALDETGILGQLGGGTYRMAFATDAPGNIAVQFVQG